MSLRPTAALGLACLGLLLATPAAAPADGRPVLPVERGTEHFLAHFDPARSEPGTIVAMLARLEAARAVVVAPLGREDGLGLPPPVADGPRGGDDRTDVYVTDLDPDLYGVALIEDDRTGFVVVTPGWPDVAWHEFMHLSAIAVGIDQALYVREAVSQWLPYWIRAGEPARRPPIDLIGGGPFEPSTPLGCPAAFAERDPTCIYDQWLIVAYGVRRYGPAFPRTLLLQTGDGAGAFDAAFRRASNGRESLATEFPRYVRRLWDPAWWRSPAIAAHLRETMPFHAGVVRISGRPGHRSTGWRAVPKPDPLTATYAQLAPVGRVGAGDRLVLQVRAGVPARVFVRDGQGRLRRDVAIDRRCRGGRCAALAPPVDPTWTTHVAFIGTGSSARPGTWRARLRRARDGRSPRRAPAGYLRR